MVVAHNHRASELIHNLLQGWPQEIGDIQEDVLCVNGWRLGLVLLFKGSTIGKGKDISFDVDRPGFEYWLCHLLAVYCQKVTYLFPISFLIFTFLFHLMHHEHLPMLIHINLLLPL